MADQQNVNPILGRLMQNQYQQEPEPQGPKPMSVPGRLGEFFGYGGRNEKPNEFTGMSDRRAFWSGMLTDLGGAITSGTGMMKGTAMQNVQNQRYMQAQQAAMKKAEDIKALNSTSQYINAVKDDESEHPSIVKEARYLFPDDPRAQQDYITKYRAKSGMTIDLGDNMAKELIKQVPEVHQGAIQAQEDYERYTMMEQLVPLMGETGPGKDFMTNLQTGLNQIGLQGAVSTLDAIGEVVGADLFSGDSGATELFRALGNEDVLNRAKELYPVSDRDITFLKEAMATLRLNDKRAMGALIDRRKRSAQGKIDQYNWYRDSLSDTGLPSLPDLRGGPSVQEYGFDQLTEEEREAIRWAEEQFAQ